MYSKITLSISIFLLFWGIMVQSAVAQAPEQDCISAIPICNNSYTQNLSYAGAGTNPNEIDPLVSCLGTGEVNDVWYIFTVQVAGNVCFSITPLNALDDYDWAVYNLTNNPCSDIFTNAGLEVSCNFSGNLGCGGVTGANGNTGGPCGGQNNPCIPVAAGETYVINVSNFSASQSGYNIDFGQSTATIFDNVPPGLTSITSPACGTTDTLNVIFTENVLCSTVQPGDFLLTGPGGPYTVTSVYNPSCAAGGTSGNGFTLTITPAITTTGTFNVAIVGSITDNCGNNVVIGTNQDFTLSNITVIASANPSIICLGQTVQLTNNFSGVLGYTHVWNPGGMGGGSVNVTPIVTTTYTVDVTNAAGCTVSDQVTVTVSPLPTSVFGISQNTACVGSPVTITYAGSAGPNAGYVWDFDGGIFTPGSGQGPYSVYWNTAGVKYVTLYVNVNGCLSPVTTDSLTIYPNISSDFTVPNNICVGDPNLVVYNGNASPSANYQWTWGGAVANPGTGQGPHTVTFPIAGTYNICLFVSENGCNSTLTCQTVTVLPQPIANIDTVGDQCLSTNSFNFSFTGTPNVDAYYWGFPGAFPPSSNIPNPSGIHYSTAGPKVIWVYVIDNGCVSDTAYATFNVIPDPVADFTASSANICQNGCIGFTYTGLPVSPIQDYHWDFGPNASPQFSTLPNLPCVVFNTPGVQTIRLIVCNQFCCDTMTQVVFVSGLPQASAGQDVNFCEGDGPVQLNGFAINGTGTFPYTYSWNCNQTPLCGISSQFVPDPFVNPGVSPTVYYLQVTDGAGCMSNIDSVTVTIKPKPKVYAGPDLFICDFPGAVGDTLMGGLAPNNLAPGPYTYSWFPSGPGVGMALGSEVLPHPYVDPPQTTIYTLVIVSANGCSSDVNTLDTASTVTVTVNPLPIVDAGEPRDICFGQTIQMHGNALGAGPLYTYTWTPSDPAAGLVDPTDPVTNATPDFTHLYTLTVESNGCIASDTMTITVHTLPTGVIEPTVADICQGDSVTLFGNADGDPTGVIYTYTWTQLATGSTAGIESPNQGTTAVFPTVNTQYLLEVGTNWCVGYLDTVLVQVKPTPIANVLNIDTLICSGTSIQLHGTYSFTGLPATPVLVNWTPSGTLATPNDTLTMATPTQTTEYTMTVSHAGECPTSDFVTISVAPAINASIAVSDSLICGGETVILSASGGNGNPTYHWNPASEVSDSTAQIVTVNPTVTTTYYLTVQEGFCSGTDSAKIVVDPLPSADVLASNLSGCVPLTVSLTENATQETGYIWDFGDQTPVSNEPTVMHTFTNPGNYTITFTALGIGNCNNIVTLPVVVSDTTFGGFTSSPEIGDSMYIPMTEVHFTDTTANATSWFWEFGDGIISSEENPSHTYHSPGEYTVTLAVTNEHGCVNHIIKAPYIVADPAVFIPNVFTPNNDGYYDNWAIQYNGKEEYNVTVFDRWGVLVFEGLSVEKVWDGTDLKGKTVADGVYFYTVKIAKKVYNGNVTLMR